ncbi:hypothetical protein R1flu_007204 [Riccia fluitans]|uniref:Calcineurin-like phosphoesterase domain-containing protein n=1 Tax=Riccia fluitans TaxID=41844 RepID=A0ABD1YZ09_9MARC
MASTLCRAARLAIVGDVHDNWDPAIDARALSVLQPDLVLFTGDFGDKNVELVSEISSLNYPKAAILGNHDCWFPHGPACSRSVFDRDPIEAQLELLGKSHVGYSRLDFPRLNVSVVGGRPGSWGGSHMHHATKKYFGASNMKQSSDLIAKAALGAPEDSFLLFLAHNGPTGLGSDPGDICGKDWTSSGGDHGDQDLESAISKVKKERKVPLVVFGHMHKELQVREERRGPRKMIVVGEDKSVYLNAAVVPRVRDFSSTGPDQDSLESKFTRNWLDNESETPSERNFTLVELENGELKKISEVWVRVEETQASLEEQTILYPID